MKEPALIWLGEKLDGPDLAECGGKGANLLLLAAAGMPVPDGYVIKTAAYRSFLLHNEQDPKSWIADGSVFETGSFPGELARDILRAGVELGKDSSQSPLLAVRSSATVEDLKNASFAGQGESFLNVPVPPGLDDLANEPLLLAVRRCWASLWSGRAQHYLMADKTPPPQMAVIVQLMIPCTVSGIAFSVDPLDGSPFVVVEAVSGLGDKLAAGEVSGERYRVRRGERIPGAGAGPDSLLKAGQLERVVELALAAEDRLNGPQDIEWGFWKDKLYLFQSRPVTVRSSGFFSDHIPDDVYTWTGGFFNERFPRPVSPLGWTVLQELLVPLALADPLRFLGVHPAGMPPLIKLYRGHPYANVKAFQMLYAVFPDRFLPADAYRYFPDGDTSLRLRVSYPRSIWSPRTFFSLALTFLLQPAQASPWHNYKTWRRFERRHTAVLSELKHRAAGKDGEDPNVLWAMHLAAQKLNRDLLGLHRWSLTMADLSFTVLRWLLVKWVDEGESETDVMAATLVTGIPSYSLQLNAALNRLAAGQIKVQSFLQEYGHRSFDLDLAHPTFADDPSQVERLARQLDRPGMKRENLHERAKSRLEVERRCLTLLSKWQRPIFRNALMLARKYMELRENQRFVWQKTLAFQRQLYLRLGRLWLEQPEDIFCATLDEVKTSVLVGSPIPRELIAMRCAELHKLEEEHRRAPELCYPPFLRGESPISCNQPKAANRYTGLPVSPGVARGPVRIVLSPD
ncbi:MAG: hypothetical protein JXA42_12830, partial [Anaerolineales bacterium]|nr:hypothetical protein [Anaerolineales bacterium]